MKINDDFSKAVFVRASELNWIASPAAGVERKMLFRVGGEVARATSLVKYAPGSAFPRHTHNGGEEILVLEGTFQDEHGDYPAGSYFRNPPGTSHVPAAKDGCIIFVRLWQYRENDTRQIVLRPEELAAVTSDSNGRTTTGLFDDGSECVTLEGWGSGQAVEIGNERGLEFLILSGEMRIGDEVYGAQTWARLPAGENLIGQTGSAGARIWLKRAPLLYPDVLQLPS